MRPKTQAVSIILFKRFRARSLSSSGALLMKSSVPKRSTGGVTRANDGRRQPGQPFNEILDFIKIGYISVR